MLLSDTGCRAGRLLRSVCYVGPGQCNIGGSRVRFRSISWLGRTLAGTVSPYSLDDFETLDYRRYLCPVCGFADRDRLYKLYVDRFLRPDGVRRVLEFAPSAPLSAYLRSRADLQYRIADLMMAGVDDVVHITDMPMYADGSFDFFTYPDGALGQLRRGSRSDRRTGAVAPLCPGRPRAALRSLHALLTDPRAGLSGHVTS
jgi:hypothetical protein